MCMSRESSQTFPLSSIPGNVYSGTPASNTQSVPGLFPSQPPHQRVPWGPQLLQVPRPPPHLTVYRSRQQGRAPRAGSGHSTKRPSPLTGPTVVYSVPHGQRHANRVTGDCQSLSDGLPRKSTHHPSPSGSGSPGEFHHREPSEQITTATTTEDHDSCRHWIH